jgi:hypothetical protein
MLLLPLGKCVLPVVLPENSKTLNITDAKVNDYGVCILDGEVSEAVEHLCHFLAFGGLGYVILARPRILGILNRVPIDIVLHLGVLVLLLGVLIPIVIAA